MSATDVETDLRALERSLAFERATRVIETSCARLPDETVEREQLDVCHDWWNLDDAIEEEKDSLAESLRYLESRGLIVRVAGHSRWIALKDEDEEQPPT